MLPERNAYSADVPTNLEERHVEGGILDQFWVVLDGFEFADVSHFFLEQLGFSQKTRGPLYDDNVVGCIGLGSKNARFSHKQITGGMKPGSIEVGSHGSPFCLWRL